MIDIVVIGVIVSFMIIGYRRGLIKTVFSLVSFVLSIFLTAVLYPIVAGILRQTPLDATLKDYITRTMNLENLVQNHTAELIPSLPLPDILLNALEQHNTPSMFDLLGVSTMEQFIAAFFAGIVINTVAMIVVFIVVRITLGVISGILDIVGRLPVIRTFNRGGGFILGTMQGVVITWIGLLVINLFFLDPTNTDLLKMLNDSVVAGWIYENNPLLIMLVRIR